MIHSHRSLNVVCSLALLLAAGTPVLVRAQSEHKQKTAAESRLSTKSWETWREGFEASEAGEAALIAGRNEEAAEYYKRALKAFKTVKKNNPNWNKNVINYRISLAEKRLNTALRRIEFQRTGSHDSTASTAAETSGGASVPHTPSDPQSEIAALRTALKIAEERNAPLQKEAEQGRLASSQVSGLIADKKETEAKYNTLLLQYEALKKQVDSSAGGTLEKAYKEEQFRSEALKKLVDDQRKELDSARQQIRAGEKELAAQKEKIAKADAALAASARSEKLLADVRRDYADLQKTVLQQREKNEARHNELSAALKEKIEECTRKDNELKSLRQKNAPSEALEKLQAEAEELRRDKKTLTEKYENLDKELRVLNDKLATTGNRETAATGMIATLNAKNKELAASAESLRKKASEQETALRDSTKKVEALEKSNKKLHDEIAMMAERVNKAPSSGTEADTALLKKEMEVKSLAEEKEKLSARVSELEKALRDEKEKLSGEKKDGQNAIAVVPVPVPADPSAEGAEPRTPHDEIEALKKTIAENEESSKQTKKEIVGLEEKVRELTAASETLKNDLQTSKTEKSKIEEDNRKLSKDLLNTLALLEKAKLEAQDTSRIRAAENERDAWKVKCEAASKKADEQKLILADRDKNAEIMQKRITELETKCDTLEKRAARAETKLAGWEQGANTVSKEELEKKNAALEKLLQEHKTLLEEQTADRKTISEMNAQLVRYRKTLQLARDVTEKSMEESRKLRAELVMYRRRDPNPRPEVPKTVTDVPQEIKELTPSENDARAQALKADTDKYETCMAAARKALQEGKQEDALWQFWAAADAAVNQPEPYLEITRIHIARNNPEQGIKTYEKALRLGAKRLPEIEAQLKQQLQAKRETKGK